MLTDFVSKFLARQALSKGEQKQNKFPLFWTKAQRAKKYSDQLCTTALVMKNDTKNLENRCFIWS